MSEAVVDKQHELDQLSINALRFLAVDGVQKAKQRASGARRWDARRLLTCCTTRS